MNTHIRLEALKEYIDRTKRILELSSPQLHGINSAEVYRVFLQGSFREIGKAAHKNNAVLDQYLLPLLEDGAKLSADDVELMRTFCSQLMDTTSMENLDHPLIYRQAEQILENAPKDGDLRERILALDGLVIAAYMMINLTTRLYPEYDYFIRYREAGMRAAYELLEHLPPEKFAQLPDEECKMLVVVNARYMRCLFEWDDLEDKSEVNEEDLRLLREAKALASDPFYREQLPNYDWDAHVFRTLQYLADLPECHNKRCFNKEQLAEIRAGVLELVEIVRNHPQYAETCPKAELEFYLLQSSYFNGLIDMKEFRAGLRDLMNISDRNDFAVRSMFTSFIVPFEYIVTFDMKNLSEEDKKVLASIYDFIASYAYRMPKTGMLSFMLTFIAMLLRNFLEVPGGMTFEDMCLKLMAGMHPPTYVHTLNVASLTKFLVEKLIDREPALFAGIAGAKDAADVLAKREEILAFAYKAALMHDVGKLFIVETIITYGRNLIDVERELLQVHTSVGAAILRRIPETAPYADVALGHQRWYDGTGGYPADFDVSASPYKSLIEVVQVADCLDAATDVVGRTYKIGMTPEENVEELRAGRGTRYAPYVVDLFEDPKIVEALHLLLEEGRDENYREAYRVLKEL